MFNPPGQEDDSKIYLNLIIEITNSNFEVFFSRKHLLEYLKFN